MAADFQNLYSNLCSEAKGGTFGSKFVTVCVSGNEQNQVEMKGYQVLTLYCIVCWSDHSPFLYENGQSNCVAFRVFWPGKLVVHYYWYRSLISAWL